MDPTRLKSTLRTSGIQQQNPALFQVIDQLIDSLLVTNSNIKDVSARPFSGTGTGTGTIINTKEFQRLEEILIEEGLIIPGSTGAAGPMGPIGPTGPLPSGNQIFNIYEEQINDEPIFPSISSSSTSGISNGAIPSVTIAQAATSGTYNLSTLGIIDWVFIGQTSTIPRLQNVGNYKRFGPHWLRDGFDWLYGNGSSPSWFAATLGSITIIQSDSSANGLTGFTGADGLFNATSIEYGFELKVPSRKTSRTLQFIFSCYSAQVELRAHLTDVGISDATTIIDPGASVGSGDRIATIVFNSANDTADNYLMVTVKTNINRGGNPNVVFSSAWLF